MTADLPILEVPLSNVYMTEAKRVAESQPPSKQPFKVGVVLVKDGQIIGFAHNANAYHEEQGCERRKLGIPSGQQHELCPGCNPQEHSEPRAIQMAKDDGHDVVGADLYMYGHYYACDSCAKTVIAHKIARYYVVENAMALFELKAS